MAHQDTNVFDSSTVARVWMNKGRAGGLAPSAIAAIDSRKPDSEGLVFHNVTYLASPTADRDSIASFTTSCLLRADATHILRARDPLPLVRTPEAGAFEIRTVHTSRDGDRGMYATRIIPSGSIIVSESPTVLLPPYLWLGSVVQTQAELLSTLFDRLPRAPGGAPDSQLSALLALKNAKAKAGSVEEGIARTNGIAVDILGMAAAGVDGTYTGIFLNIARCNHSCAPNAMLHWDPQTLTMTLYAARKIEQKEEICIAYIDIVQDSSTRQKQLQILYNFACQCEVCSLPEKALLESDAARLKLRGWLDQRRRTTFSAWYDTTEDPSASLQERQRKTQAFRNTLVLVANVYKAEKLHAVRAPLMEASDAFARLYGAFGDEVNFAKRIRTAVSVWKVDDAVSVSVQKRLATYHKWLADAKSFPQWAERSAIAETKKT